MPTCVLLQRALPSLSESSWADASRLLGSFGQVGWQVLRRSGAGLRAGEVFVASKNMLVVRHLRYVLCTGVAFFREMRLKHGAGARPPLQARATYVLLKMLARARVHSARAIGGIGPKLPPI